MHADDADKDAVRLANMRAGVARTILNTQVRVDDQRMKRQVANIIPDILKRVEEERLRLAREGTLELVAT